MFKKQNKKKKQYLILLSLGLILVISGCFYTVKTSQNIESQLDKVGNVEDSNTDLVDNSEANDQNNIENSDEIDTIDWVTYKNDELEIEIKYPKEWFVDNITDSSFMIKNEEGVYVWLSVPPLGFGYNRNKAEISKIIIDNIEAEQLKFIDNIVVNFKKGNQEGLIRFKYFTEKESKHIDLFNHIIKSLKFIK